MMSLTTSEFISRFHNLEGDLIGEKRKNLFNLLRNKPVLPQNEQFNEAIKNIVPKNYLETLFKVDMLIYFKRTPDLYEILMSGNEACKSKILKQSWFFKEVFLNIAAEKLVNTILPQLSFAMRMKLLKILALALPEEKIGDMFEELLKRYGFNCAKTILPSCTSKKIEEVNRTYDVSLTFHQLKLIFNKNRNLIEIYLEEYKKNTGQAYESDVFYKYVAEKDPDMFLRLKAIYEFDINLGRRNTKRMVSLYKNDIISSPDKFSGFLKSDVIVRKLGADFKIFYSNVFPKNIEDYKNSYDKFAYLKYYPKKYQYPLFIDTFNKMYKISIYDELDCLDDDFFNIIMDLAERTKWAELKYKETKNVDYIKFYHVETSLPLMKEKINLTSNFRDRSKLLSLLVETCSINKDMKALEDVLKYYCFRHRNDDKAHSKFLDTIKNKLDLRTLSDCHWRSINEILTVQIMKNLTYWSYPEFTYFYMEFLLSNNKPIDEVIKSFIKNSHKCETYPQTWEVSRLKNPKIEQLIYLKLIEFLPDFNKSEIRDEINRQLIYDIVVFNKENKKRYSIPFIEYPYLKNSLINMLSLASNYTYQLQEILTHLLFKPNRSSHEDTILEECWKNNTFEEIHHNIIFARYFLKYNPDMILKNFEKFMVITIAQQTHSPCTSFIWNLIKKYHHLKLDLKVIDYCKIHLKDESFENRLFCVRPLACIMDGSNYIEYIKTYYPITGKVSLQSTENRELFKLQTEIAKNLKYVDLKISSESVIQFCNGDYLSAALRSLLSLCHRIPETKVPAIVEQLKARNVSIRKHVMFIGCIIYNQEKVIELLKCWAANENDTSLKIKIFFSTLKCFAKNPSDDLFNLLRNIMIFLRKADDTYLEKLIQFRISSKKYKSQLVEDVWRLLEERKTDGDDTSNLKDTLLKTIDKELIQSLAEDFRKRVIETTFLQSQKKVDNLEGIFSFVIRNLLHCNNRNESFDIVFKVVQNYKKTSWYGDNKTSKMAYCNMKKFVSEFYEALKEYDQPYENLVVLFFEQWEKSYKALEMFEEYLLLRFLLLRSKAKDVMSDKFVFDVTSVVEQTINTYGPYVLGSIANSVEKCLFNFEVVDKFIFYNKILKLNPNTVNSILVIKLLPDVDCKINVESQDIYNDILQTLKSVEDTAVQLMYRIYLRK